METTATPPVSKAALWTGRVMSTLPSLMLLFSGAMKFTTSPQMVEGFQHMGVPFSQAVGLGILEIGCTLIYLIPRTSVLGAILLTGYLGGAIQTHVRIGEPVFTHVILGVFIWGGIFLRDPRIRALIPFKK